MSESDDALTQRIRGGDREALAEFIRRRTPQLQAFLHKRMSDRLRQKVEPDDLLQELTVSCLNSLQEIELGDRDPFRWLCQQAERRIIDAHRHHFGAQKRQAGREVALNAGLREDGKGDLGDLIAASLTSPSEAYSRDQKEFHLLRALSALPDDAREALRLRYLEGLPSKEIAERLGRTDGAVRVLLSRALTRLQESLGADPEFQTLLAQARKRGE